MTNSNCRQLLYYLAVKQQMDSPLAFRAKFTYLICIWKWIRIKADSLRNGQKTEKNNTDYV